MVLIIIGQIEGVCLEAIVCIRTKDEVSEWIVCPRTQNEKGNGTDGGVYVKAKEFTFFFALKQLIYTFRNTNILKSRPSLSARIFSRIEGEIPLNNRLCM